MKSEDKNLPVATSPFSSYFILFPGLKGSFTAIKKKYILYWDIVSKLIQWVCLSFETA